MSSQIPDKYFKLETSEKLTPAIATKAKTRALIILGCGCLAATNELYFLVVDLALLYEKIVENPDPQDVISRTAVPDTFLLTSA